MAGKVEAEPAALSDDAASEDDAAAQAEAHKQAQARQKRTMRADVARRRAALKQQEAERALPAQILLIILNSIGAAVVSALLAALIISQLPGSSTFANPDMSKLVLVMSFLLGFLFTLLFLMRRLPPNWWQLANEIATSEKYRAPNQKWGGVLAQDESDYAPLFDTSRKISEVPPSLFQPDETPFSTAPVVEDQGDETATGSEDPQALFNAAPKTEEQRTEEALAQAKALAIAEIDRFTSALNETIQSAGRALDAASRFAMQLYVAGACSAVARKFLLSAKDALSLVVRALTQVGTGRMFAESCASNIEDYARRDVYREIITGGQKAMGAQLDGGPIAATGALATFEAWAIAADKTAIPRVVTFLFTDIVDAAALTQRLGNLHAQRVIKAHDEAVNEAIEKNKGKKVKHTGDGMITTFPDPAKAVAAAQAIQQRLDAHNKRMPHLSANVRIAINAGEAVLEDGNFFGSTVKMTAQICGLAKAGQILAADVVKAFCKSSPQSFQPFGDIDVEGISKTRPVFEVSWMKSGAGLEYTDIGQPAG